MVIQMCKTSDNRYQDAKFCYSVPIIVIYNFVVFWFFVVFNNLVFCLLSFDCSFCLTAWYLYIFYLFLH